MFFFRKHVFTFTVLILSVFSILPLFEAGFFPMHDDTQVARVYEMGKALKDGMFPVRWVQDLGYGYGYPIFNFYAPLAYYAGGLFNALGFDALTATKIMMGLGVVLSGVFMYLLAKEFFGKLGGLAAGLFYVYAPYHALDIYVRGDVAEFWAYAFIPLMFLGFYNIFDSCHAELGSTSKKIPKPIQQVQGRQVRDDKTIKWIIVGSLGYAGVILSHNLTAMMVTPFLIVLVLIFIYLSVMNKKIQTAYYLILATILGLLLSAFYWLPALTEMKYTNVFSQIGGSADFKDHFVCLSQLWESQWGFGGSTKECLDGMSFILGKIYVLLLLIVLFLLSLSLFKKSFFTQYKKQNIAAILSIIGFVMVTFLTLSFSKPIWDIIIPMKFFQYPWRFLLLSSFFLSLLSGYLIFTLLKILSKNKIFAYVLSGIILLLLFYSNLDLFKPQTIFQTNPSDYINSIKDKTSKTSDEYMPRDFKKPENLSELPKESVEEVDNVVEIDIAVTEKKTQKLSAMISSFSNSKIKVNIAPFLSWHFYLNKKEIKAEKTNSGYSIFLPKGKNELIAQFESTPIQKISNVLSAAGLMVLFIGIISPKLFYGKKS